MLYLSATGTPQAGRPMITFAVALIIIGLQVLIFGFLAAQNRSVKRQLLRMHRDISKRK